MKYAPLVAVLFALPAQAQEYRFPIEAGGNAPYITAYRDLSSGGGIQDWNCGTNAYNGHRGTDIGIGGFPAMDAGSKWVVAAADGEVTFAVEGCFDRCTSGQCNCGGGFGNYVKVTHADGKSTFYGHLMQGSVQVSVGDRIVCGQRLGKVGSSGNSTGPHLHFEPRYSNNVSDDPFSGQCGGPISFWVAQGNYNALPGTTCMNGMPPPPPDTAVVKGVVWDRSVTDSPSAAGNQRIPGTMVTLDGTTNLAARPVDAYWEFTVPVGEHVLTYSAPGYVTAEQRLTVTAGETRWASLGLVPESGAPPERDDAILVEGPMLIEVEPEETFEVVFVVENTGTTTWANGEVVLAFDSGDDLGAREGVPLDSSDLIAPGDEKAWRLVLTATAADGTYGAAWQMTRNGARFGPLLEMTARVVTATVTPEEPGEPEEPVEPEQPFEPQPEPPLEEGTPEIEVRAAGKKIGGGCGCSATERSSSPWALLLLLGFAVRRVTSGSRPS
ncbi:MAG: peptidoglycan DD-metalloendopeptidase family protein [Deltaproteobacteria bacterium]